MPPLDDLAFGNAAIELGLCTPEQIRECLVFQTECRQNEQDVLLGRILIDRQYIQPSDVRTILERQKRQEVTCLSCGHAFAAPTNAAAQNCPLCSEAVYARQKDTKSVEPPHTPTAEMQRSPPTPTPAAAGKREGSQEPGAERAPIARLVLASPGSDALEREHFVYPEGSLIVGRSQKVDLRIDDPAMSRKHCRFYVQDDDVFVEDMGSRNGTLVNSAEIRAPVRLRAGDEILLGDTRVRYHVAGQAAPSTGGPALASRFCAHCGVLISLADVHSGVAQSLGDHTYCGECLVKQVFPGRQMDEYVVEEKVGEGGMATVWRARDVRNGNVVALKVLLNSSQVKAHSRRRFLNEAAAGMRLEHPGLAKIYAQGECGGIPYIAMEFVEGKTVARRLDEEGTLSIGQATRIAIEIADVLDYAHASKLVHRDVKPANIVIDERTGSARLLDLGVVKIEDESMTRTGVGLGTLEYAPPEQLADAKHVDHRADIYSLGATLYRMVTGHRPFTGRSPLDIARAIVNDPVPWSREDAALAGPELKALIDRCMAKDPAERYPTCKDLAAALEPFAE